MNYYNWTRFDGYLICNDSRKIWLRYRRWLMTEHCGRGAFLATIVKDSYKGIGADGSCLVRGTLMVKEFGVEA